MTENTDLIKELETMLKFEDKFKNLKEEGNELIRLAKNKCIPKNVSDDFLMSFTSSIYRRDYIKYCGFALLTEEFIDNLYEYVKYSKCLEIMAGKGAISKELKDRGVDVIATDDYSWDKKLRLSDTWINIEKIDCIEAIKKYGKDVDFIICSWIPYEDSIGYEALKTMNDINPSCKMIVFGEAKYGCTAEGLFFDHSESVHGNEVGYESDIEGYKSWNSIHDKVNVVIYKD